jgi:hypothetical protein
LTSGCVRPVCGQAPEKTGCSDHRSLLFYAELRNSNDRIAFVIGNQLGFQQFQEQDPVNPGNAQLKTHIKKPLLHVITKLPWIGEPRNLVETVNWMIAFSSTLPVFRFVLLCFVRITFLLPSWVSVRPMM